MIPALLLISFAVFMIINLIPGDPAEIMAGSKASEAQLEALTVKFGLDKPLLTRYFIWLKNVVKGDLGVSLISSQPIAEMIMPKLGATLELTLVATLLSLIISFPLGIFSALYPNSWFDRWCTIFSAIFFAIPGFWLGILLILAFSLFIPILPASGRPDFFVEPIAHMRALVLPALTISIGLAARTVRFLRASLLDVLSQDYIVTAKARGANKRCITTRHALRNALIPVITVVGLQMGSLFGGALIIEQIFAWPGIGRLTIQAISWRDYGLLQANVLYIVLMFMSVNLVVDILTAMVDPRIRLK